MYKHSNTRFHNSLKEFLNVTKERKQRKKEHILAPSRLEPQASKQTNKTIKQTQKQKPTTA
jgi:hypothetical protein